jgi:hypothetical protein
VRPQQTLLRPQLVAQPSPVATQAPPQKSKDLAFVDLGASAPASQRNATVIEARKAPAPAAAPGPAQSKVEQKSAVPTSEVEFRVMDGGIESPVRTSQGQRTIPEDLDLLFDAPAHQPKAPPSPSVAPSPVPPRTQAQPAARISAPKVEKPVVEATPAAAQKPELPKPETVAVRAPKVDASAPRAAVKVDASAPRAAVKVDASAPRAAVVAPEAPRKPLGVPKPAVAEDMTIPGESLLVAPSVDHAVTSSAPQSPPAGGRSIGMLAGASVAVLIAVAGLLAWKPWSGRVPSPPNGTQSTPSAPLARPNEPATSPPVASLPNTPTGTQPAAKPGVPTAPVTKPVEVAAKPDSSVARPADDQVIAAARPNFKAEMSVPSSDLGLGSEIRTGTTATVVPPTELTSRLEAAEKLAQLELGTKLGGFHGLLAPNRLATADGVASARTAWASGAEVIRQYRARIARMESAYEDSVLTSQRAQRWSSEEMRAWAGHQSQAEPVETSQLADLMFSQVSEGLDILAALDGQYEIKGGLIAFKNSASATRYTSIRGWVEQRMQAWSATPESARANSVSAILRALGDGFPAIK